MVYRSNSTQYLDNGAEETTSKFPTDNELKTQKNSNKNIETTTYDKEPSSPASGTIPILLNGLDIKKSEKNNEAEKKNIKNEKSRLRKKSVNRKSNLVPSTANMLNKKSEEGLNDNKLINLSNGNNEEEDNHNTIEGEDESKIKEEDKNMFSSFKHPIQTINCSLPLEKVSDILEKLNIRPKSVTPSGSPPESVSSLSSVSCSKSMCLYCDRSFTSHNLREKHSERVHQVKKERRLSSRNIISQIATATATTPPAYPGCTFCNTGKISLLQTDDLNGLFTHLMDKHSDKYFACKICMLRFPNDHSMSEHNHEIHLNNSGKIHSHSSATSSRVNSPLNVEVDFEKTIVANLISNKLTSTNSSSSRKNEEEEDDDSLPRLRRSSSARKKHQLLKSEDLILSRLGVTQNRSPRTMKGAKNRRAATTENYRQPSTESYIIKNLRNKVAGRILNTTTQQSSTPTDSVESPQVPLKVNTQNVKNTNESSSASTFDDDFYETVSLNVRNNLSCHLDGKIGARPTSPSPLSPVLADPPLRSTVVRSPLVTESEIHEATNLSSVTAFPTLLTADQYGSEPTTSKIKRTFTKNSWKWKWDFIKKYKYVNEGGKIVKKIKQQTSGFRDLSKLDMWTQLTMRTKHELIRRNENNSQFNENTAILGIGEAAREEKRKVIEELNTILDKRLLPEINIEQNEQRIIKQEVLDDEELNASGTGVECENESGDGKDEQNFIAMLNLEKKVNKNTNKDTVILSGEWARPRCYVCFGCGEKFETLKILEEHKHSSHPHVLSTHYEIVGRELIERELYRHFYIPSKALQRHTEYKIKLTNNESNQMENKIILEDSLDSIASASCSTITKSETCDTDSNSKLSKISSNTTVTTGSISSSCGTGIASSSTNTRQIMSCTKCNRECSGMFDLYRHMLDCSGDYAWLIAKKRMRYRYFGNRTRRRKTAQKHNFRGRPPKLREPKSEDGDDGETETPRTKEPQTPRSKPSDAESIERMLANLPAKRACRQIIPNMTLKKSRVRKMVPGITIKTKNGANKQNIRLTRTALKNLNVKHMKNIKMVKHQTRRRIMQEKQKSKLIDEDSPVALKNTTTKQAAESITPKAESTNTSAVSSENESKSLTTPNSRKSLKNNKLVSSLKLKNTNCDNNEVNAEEKDNTDNSSVKKNDDNQNLLKTMQMKTKSVVKKLAKTFNVKSKEKEKDRTLRSQSNKAIDEKQNETNNKKVEKQVELEISEQPVVEAIVSESEKTEDKSNEPLKEENVKKSSNKLKNKKFMKNLKFRNSKRLSQNKVEDDEIENKSDSTTTVNTDKDNKTPETATSEIVENVVEVKETSEETAEIIEKEEKNETTKVESVDDVPKSVEEELPEKLIENTTNSSAILNEKPMEEEKIINKDEIPDKDGENQSEDNVQAVESPTKLMKRKKGRPLKNMIEKIKSVSQKKIEPVKTNVSIEPMKTTNKRKKSVPVKEIINEPKELLNMEKIETENIEVIIKNVDLPNKTLSPSVETLPSLQSLSASSSTTSLNSLASNQLQVPSGSGSLPKTPPSSKKKVKKLNDCIAMLTGKLHEKLGIPFAAQPGKVSENENNESQEITKPPTTPPSVPKKQIKETIPEIIPKCNTTISSVNKLPMQSPKKLSETIKSTPDPSLPQIIIEKKSSSDLMKAPPSKNIDNYVNITPISQPNIPVEIIPLFSSDKRTSISISTSSNMPKTKSYEHSSLQPPSQHISRFQIQQGATLGKELSITKVSSLINRRNSIDCTGLSKFLDKRLPIQITPIAAPSKLLDAPPFPEKPSIDVIPRKLPPPTSVLESRNIIQDNKQPLDLTPMRISERRQTTALPLSLVETVEEGPLDLSMKSTSISKRSKALNCPSNMHSTLVSPKNHNEFIQKKQKEQCDLSAIIPKCIEIVPILLPPPSLPSQNKLNENLKNNCITSTAGPMTIESMKNSTILPHPPSNSIDALISSNQRYKKLDKTEIAYPATHLMSVISNSLHHSIAGRELYLENFNTTIRAKDPHQIHKKDDQPQMMVTAVSVPQPTSLMMDNSSHSNLQNLMQIPIRIPGKRGRKPKNYHENLQKLLATPQIAVAQIQENIKSNEIIGNKSLIVESELKEKEIMKSVSLGIVTSALNVLTGVTASSTVTTTTTTTTTTHLSKDEPTLVTTVIEHSNEDILDSIPVHKICKAPEISKQNQLLEVVKESSMLFKPGRKGKKGKKNEMMDEKDDVNTVSSIENLIEQKNDEVKQTIELPKMSKRGRKPKDRNEEKIVVNDTQTISQISALSTIDQPTVIPEVQQSLVEKENDKTEEKTEKEVETPSVTINEDKSNVSNISQPSVELIDNDDLSSNDKSKRKARSKKNQDDMIEESIVPESNEEQIPESQEVNDVVKNNSTIDDSSIEQTPKKQIKNSKSKSKAKEPELSTEELVNTMISLNKSLELVENLNKSIDSDKSRIDDSASNSTSEDAGSASKKKSKIKNKKLGKTKRKRRDSELSTEELVETMIQLNKTIEVLGGGTSSVASDNSITPQKEEKQIKSKKKVSNNKNRRKTKEELSNEELVNSMIELRKTIEIVGKTTGKEEILVSSKLDAVVKEKLQNTEEKIENTLPETSESLSVPTLDLPDDKLKFKKKTKSVSDKSKNEVQLESENLSAMEFIAEPKKSNENIFLSPLPEKLTLAIESSSDVVKEKYIQEETTNNKEKVNEQIEPSSTSELKENTSTSIVTPPAPTPPAPKPRRKRQSELTQIIADQLLESFKEVDKSRIDELKLLHDLSLETTGNDDILINAVQTPPKRKSTMKIQTEIIDSPKRTTKTNKKSNEKTEGSSSDLTPKGTKSDKSKKKNNNQNASTVEESTKKNKAGVKDEEKNDKKEISDNGKNQTDSVLSTPPVPKKPTSKKSKSDLMAVIDFIPKRRSTRLLTVTPDISASDSNSTITSPAPATPVKELEKLSITDPEKQAVEVQKIPQNKSMREIFDPRIRKKIADSLKRDETFSLEEFLAPRVTNNSVSVEIDKNTSMVQEIESKKPAKTIVSRRKTMSEAIIDRDSASPMPKKTSKQEEITKNDEEVVIDEVPTKKAARISKTRRATTIEKLVQEDEIPKEPRPKRISARRATTLIGKTSLIESSKSAIETSHDFIEKSPSNTTKPKRISGRRATLSEKLSTKRDVTPEKQIDENKSKPKKISNRRATMVEKNISNENNSNDTSLIDIENETKSNVNLRPKRIAARRATMIETFLDLDESPVQSPKTKKLSKSKAKSKIDTNEEDVKEPSVEKPRRIGMRRATTVDRNYSELDEIPDAVLDSSPIPVASPARPRRIGTRRNTTVAEKKELSETSVVIETIDETSEKPNESTIDIEKVESKINEKEVEPIISPTEDEEDESQELPPTIENLIKNSPLMKKFDSPIRSRRVTERRGTVIESESASDVSPLKNDSSGFTESTPKKDDEIKFKTNKDVEDDSFLKKGQKRKSLDENEDEEDKSLNNVKSQRNTYYKSPKDIKNKLSGNSNEDLKAIDGTTQQDENGKLIRKSDSEDEICLADIAKNLNNKTVQEDEFSNCSETPAIDDQIIDMVCPLDEREDDLGRKVEFNLDRNTTVAVDDLEDNNTNTDLVDMDLEDDVSVYTSISIDTTATGNLGSKPKKRRHRRSFFKSRKKQHKNDDDSTEEFICELCNKVFRKLDSLSKHKMTLTHIAKLSEQEFLNAKRNSTVSEEKNSSSISDSPEKSPSKSISKLSSPSMLSPPAPLFHSNKSPSKSPSKSPQKLLHINSCIEPISSPEQLDNSYDRYNSRVHVENSRFALSQEERLFYECCNMLKGSDRNISGGGSANVSAGTGSSEIKSPNKNQNNIVYSVKSPISQSQSSPRAGFPKIDLNQFSDISSDSNQATYTNHPSVLYTSGNLSPSPNPSTINNTTNINSSKISIESGIETSTNNNNNNGMTGFFASAEKYLNGTTSLPNSYKISTPKQSPHPSNKNLLKENDKLPNQVNRSIATGYPENSMLIGSYSDIFSDMGDSFPSSQDASESENYTQAVIERSKQMKDKRECKTFNEQKGNDDDAKNVHSGPVQCSYYNMERNEDVKSNANASRLAYTSPLHSNSSQSSSTSKLITKGALKGYDNFKVSIPTTGIDLNQALVRSSHGGSKLAALADIALGSDAPLSAGLVRDHPVGQQNEPPNIPLTNDDEEKISENKEKEEKEIEMVKSSEDVDNNEEIVEEVQNQIKSKSNNKKVGKNKNVAKNSSRNISGNKLGFKEKKLKNQKPKNKGKQNKNGSKQDLLNQDDSKKSVDVYEFEDSHDSADQPIVPLSKVSGKFRGKLLTKEMVDLIDDTEGASPKLLTDEKIPLQNEESQSTSFSDRDDFQYGAVESSSSSSSSSSSDDDDDEDGGNSSKKKKNDDDESGEELNKLPDANNLQKKCLIMGRIFKNAKKTQSTVISENDVTEEKQSSGKTKKLPKQELDKLFDSLKEVDKKNKMQNNEEDDEDDDDEDDDDGESTLQNGESFVFDENKLKRSSSKKSKKSREIQMLEEEWGMSLEQIKEIIGVGQRKSQRKCAVGKQKILAETWSSDEYEDFHTTKDIIALIQETEIKALQRRNRNNAKNNKNKAEKNENNEQSSEKAKDNNNESVGNNNKVSSEKTENEEEEQKKEIKNSKENISTNTKIDKKIKIDENVVEHVIESVNKKDDGEMKPPTSTKRAAKIKPAQRRRSTAVKSRLVYYDSESDFEADWNRSSRRNKIKKRRKTIAFREINKQNTGTITTKSQKTTQKIVSDVKSEECTKKEKPPVENLSVKKPIEKPATNVIVNSSNSSTSSGGGNTNTNVVTKENKVAHQGIPNVVENEKKISKSTAKSNSGNVPPANNGKESKTTGSTVVSSGKSGKKAAMVRNKRRASEMLYYWSSSSEDEEFGRVKSPRLIADEEDEDEETEEIDHLQQHGWIVGDSHKKLVTLLAHAKGKMADDCGVKESGNKKKS